VKRQAAAALHETTGRGTERTGFPVVGIGASAGGLEAIKTLFHELPKDLGMAFVVVQHLDPKHASMMSELLARVTAMPVLEATDQMVVMPNHVYVIPPNRNLAILHHKLQLMPRGHGQAGYKPIDYFFHALARDLGSHAIGIILSGSGSDGTLGLKAIKAEGGITFSQDEASAEYDGMPHSAIAAGFVDAVLAPIDIARELIRIGRHSFVSSAPAMVAGDPFPNAEQELNKIFVLLRARTGHDFTYYKQPTVKRRIKRRMLLHEIERLPDYVKFLHDQPGETDALFHDMLINVTNFFRDPDLFEVLAQKVYPRLIKDRPDNEPIRVWVPGCSTGEEAYSLAITLLETLGDAAHRFPIQIFATDIDEKAITAAREGIYPEAIASEVSPARLKRFFTKIADGYRLNKNIRDMCVFAVQNVIKDPPFSRLDIVCCRNLLIYLEAILQKRVLQICHYALRPKGVLVLGSSETIGSHPDLFAVVDKAHRVYAKRSGPARIPPEVTIAAEPINKGRPGAEAAGNNRRWNAQHAAEQLLLAEYGPSGVIVDDSMDILHFRGQTGPYLAPVPGTASLNVLKLALPELTMPLRTSIHQAIKTDRPVRKAGIALGAERGVIDIRVVPLKDPTSGVRYFLVLFEPRKPPAAARGSSKQRSKSDGKDPRTQKLQRELRSTREYLQTIIEDQEATNEELRSANEEILSSNEELQSTNEELETAKEELQSANEEMATVNDELQERNAELTQANNDLGNLLSSINIPIVMLGDDMRIRLFTPAAGKILNLIGADVGRPLRDINGAIDVAGLEAMVVEVIDSVTPKSVEVQDRHGRCYSMMVRPYKTADQRIEGAVIALVDIEETRKGERLRVALDAEERHLAAVVRDSNDAILVYDFDGRISAWNPTATRMYGYTEAQARAMNIRAIVPPPARAALDQLIARVRNRQLAPPIEVERVTKNGELVRVYQVVSAIVDSAGEPVAIASTEKLITA